MHVHRVVHYSDVYGELITIVRMCGSVHKGVVPFTMSKHTDEGGGGRRVVDGVDEGMEV